MVNRETKHPKPSSTLKDINLLNLKISENILKFSPFDSMEIIEILKEDTQLLMKGNIMDYSMLLAIEENRLFRPPGSI
jgi:Phosphatidylinositol-4-phosphate 5-Kinase